MARQPHFYAMKKIEIGLINFTIFLGIHNFIEHIQNFKKIRLIYNKLYTRSLTMVFKNKPNQPLTYFHLIPLGPQGKKSNY